MIYILLSQLQYISQILDNVYAVGCHGLISYIFIMNYSMESSNSAATISSSLL